MPNPEKKIELGKMDPGLREKFLKGKTFKFSEEEKKEKMKDGTSEGWIKKEEEEVRARQELGLEEKRAAEDEIKLEAEQKKISQKPSFEEFKAQQEAEFKQKADAARKKLEAAYQEEGEEKEKETA